MNQFKKTLGISTFLLAIVFLFNSFLAFIILALVGSLIFPKSMEYIEQRIKLSRMAKNTLILVLFPIGLILGIYKTVNGMGDADEKAKLELDATLIKKNLSICQVCENLQSSKDTQTYKESLGEDIFNKVINNCKMCESQKMDRLRDSLNKILEPKNLDVCKVISDLGAIDLDCIHKADKKFPNFGVKHTEYTSQCEKERYLVYQKKHGLSEDMISTIMSFVMECTENERAEMRLKSKLEEETNEEIEDCFKTVRFDVKDRVKNSLHNPKSFEEVSCIIYGHNENTFQIKYTFRGENGNGAIRTETIIAEINIKNCSIVGIQE